MRTEHPKRLIPFPHAAGAVQHYAVSRSKFWMHLKTRVGCSACLHAWSHATDLNSSVLGNVFVHVTYNEVQGFGF